MSVHAAWAGRDGRSNRALTPMQEQAVREAMRELPNPHKTGGQATVRAARIRALAAQYGVSVRCIHRTLDRAPRSVVEVVVGRYKAVFEDAEEGPIQLTPWYAA